MIETTTKLNEVVRRIYAELGHGESAIQAVLQEIDTDSELTTAVLREGIKCVLLQAQARARMTIMQEVKSSPPKTYSAEMQDAVKFRCGKWYNWPLMDGTPLRDATREKLLSDAERYRRNKEGNARNEQFLRLIAERVKGDRTVGQSKLTEESIGKLMEQARSGVAASVE